MFSGLFIFIVSFVFGAITCYSTIRFGQIYKQWNDYMNENQIEKSYFDLINKNKDLKNKLKKANQEIEEVKKENVFLFNEALKKSI